MTPIERIQSDRAQARRLEDPNANLCFLALADKNGNASVRTLVLRELTASYVTLFVNKTSPKWQTIAAGGSAELLLWYPSVQHQYRIQGPITEIDRDTIEHSWQRRPVGSKYLDYVYEQLGTQSSIIPSREILVDKIRQLRTTTNSDSLEAPPSATGIHLQCSTIEMLDLTKEDRIHDRQRFTRHGDEWRAETMIP